MEFVSTSHELINDNVWIIVRVGGCQTFKLRQLIEIGTWRRSTSHI
jgi:hypothetical protein